MQVDPDTRVVLAVHLVKNTARAEWLPEEKEAVSGFFFAYQEFRGEEGLKLQRKLSSMRGMQIPKEILRRNPLVVFGMTEGKREGRQEGEVEIVLRLLNRRLGSISRRYVQAIHRLPLKQLEALAEALLDFQTSADFRRWLKSHSK